MGILYIVPTPIGNLEDITLRALNVLTKVEYIACEDTRKTGQLLKLFQERFDVEIKQNIHLISYYDQNELQRIPGILNLLVNGFDVALVSDAGTPLISDPGFKLIRTCRDQNLPVVALGGVSSVIVALIAAGLPTDKFFFLGYPPHKSGHRKTFFGNIKMQAAIFSTTFIFFEAPHKIKKTLSEMDEAFGNSEIVICRELTKMHEEIWRGSIEDAMEKYKKLQPKGEFVLLLHL